MLNPIFTDPNNSLLRDRLNRISQQLRNTKLSTAEDYAAEIYSSINSVISLGLSMTPLKTIEGQGIVGNVIDNYTSLNNDSQDIANEILRIEELAANAFNKAASSQNQLRQQIREFVYSSNKKTYKEDFLNAEHLTSVTANIDFNAAVATNSLLTNTMLAPVISIGPNSVGAIDPNSDVSNLTNAEIDTIFSWNGASLELFLTFSTAKIVNRITINLDNYKELEIDTFTTSPDGTLVQDVLLDLGVESILVDGTSNKFSGVVVIDFPPRYILSARLIINDRVGSGLIALRQLSCSQVRYSATGQLTSLPISYPTGVVTFAAVQDVFAPYVSITHQISYDGTQFIAISPGDTIILTSTPFFYRALLSTNTSTFTAASTPLVQSPLDPVASPYYVLSRTMTTPLGNGIIERTLQLNTVTGPITLRDIPLVNSIVIQEGSVILNSNNGDYTLSNNTISFPTPVTGLTISYQTSSLGSSAAQDLEEYYTPLLREFSFEAI